MENLQFFATPAGFTTTRGVVPTPEPHDLLVAVAGIAVNPIDLKLRAGLRQPTILGFDAVGKVVSTGAAVTDFHPGDRVIYAGTTKRPGSNQRFQLIDAHLAALAPADLPTATLAALPLVGLTAWELLFEKLGFTPAANANSGTSLLIINGAGGVGTTLAQLAQWAGITVFATASPTHHAWLRQHGVTYPLDYHQDLVAAVTATGHASVNAVAILYAPEPYLAIASALIAPLGHIASIVTPSQPLDLAPLKPKSASFAQEYMFTKTEFGVAMASQGEILARLAALVAAGQLDPGVSETFTAITSENLAQASDRVESGHTVGKIVLTGEFAE